MQTSPPQRSSFSQLPTIIVHVVPWSCVHESVLPYLQIRVARHRRNCIRRGSAHARCVSRRRLVFRSPPREQQCEMQSGGSSGPARALRPRIGTRDSRMSGDASEWCVLLQHPLTCHALLLLPSPSVPLAVSLPPLPMCPTPAALALESRLAHAQDGAGARCARHA